MSFVVKLLGGWLQEHAVDKLAQNKAFQALAVKTIDGLEAARQKAAALGQQVADNPEEAAAVAREQASSLWAALKADAKRDLDAFLAAQRSKDPSTQVGACVVDALRRVVSVGYNGFPSGCSDAELPWAREAASPLERALPPAVVVSTPTPSTPPAPPARPVLPAGAAGGAPATPPASMRSP
jgi:hypothetical protein